MGEIANNGYFIERGWGLVGIGNLDLLLFGF